MILILIIRRITAIFQSVNPKKPLATLKQEKDNRNISEIAYISKLIRLKSAKNTLNIEYCSNDERIAKNFSGYCKDVFEKEDTVKQGFKKEAWHSFFKKL